MPIELAALITPAEYHYLMGLAGIASGFVVMVIWSRGL